MRSGVAAVAGGGGGGRGGIGGGGGGGRRRSRSAATMATAAALVLGTGRMSAAFVADVRTAACRAGELAGQISPGAEGHHHASSSSGKKKLRAEDATRWRRRDGGADHPHHHHHHHCVPTSPLHMATDSRELRFYGTASSSPAVNGKPRAAAARAAVSPLESLLSSPSDDTYAVFASRSYRNKNGMAKEMSVRSVASAATKGLFSSAAGATTTVFADFGKKDRAPNGREGADPRSDRDQTNGPGPSSSSSSSSPGPIGSGSPVLGPPIRLSDEERELFKLLTQVVEQEGIATTLRVAGGWVRDKLLATEEFRHPAGRMYSVHDEIDPMPLGLERLTSKFKSKGEGGMLFTGPSMGRKGGKLIGTPKKESADGSSYRITDDGSLLKESHPVDIDIALDDMLGREFADRLNDWLVNHGREAHSVGVVLKNPEKSKHLETATMKVGEFWIDFVNLRAEEYTEDSRIPDLMRIGTAEEDAYRRDLTINALFYNVNTGRVEDWTGRGFADLARGAVATPLPPLTTLLDDPLRVLRSVRFAARLRFAMDTELREAARDVRVRRALAQKVARERVGAEVDLMLRSKDPVGAMRLLVNLRLAGTVFPIEGTVNGQVRDDIFDRGLTLLSATHDHLLDCKLSPPAWCNKKRAAMLASHGACERMLMDDEEARRFLWYAAFLKPFRDCVQAERAEADEREGGARMRGKKANRSAITRLMVDELKRPARDAEASEKIMKAADQFTDLMRNGGDLTVAAIAMREMRVKYEYDVECDVDYFLDANGDCFSVKCTMLEEGGGATKTVDVSTETDPVWKRAMEFRLKAAKILDRVGPLWRAALILSLSARLAELTEDELNSATERDILEQDFEEMRLGVVERHDAFAASLLNLGLIGIWYQQPLLDGGEMKGSVLSGIPKGPAFREVMEEQGRWMLMHPGGTRKALADHMRKRFPDYVC